MLINNRKHCVVFILLLLVFTLALSCSMNAIAGNMEGAHGPGSGAGSQKNNDHGRKDSKGELCEAAHCEENCDQHTANTKDEAFGFSSTSKAGGKFYNPYSIGHSCYVTPNPPEPPKPQAPATKGNDMGHHVNTFNGGCPCPGGITVEQDGCSLVFKCSMGGSDQQEIVKVTTPCPTVSVFTPQYPLVKMMSFALVEWNEPAIVSGPQIVSYGAPNGLSSPGNYYGAEYYFMDFDVTVSSIDLGTNQKFTEQKANAKKASKSVLDRHNFQFILAGDNEYVEVLDQQEIYDAYKNNSKYVQAYTVFTKAQNFGQRPWYTYEELVQYMCKNLSKNPNKCYKELSYNVHKDAGMEGDLWLGNGNTSLLGVYSEVSSHGCHGATVVDELGNPAFAVTVKSKWCVEISATYDLFQWQLDEIEYIGECCIKHQWVYDHTNDEVGCAGTTSDGEKYGCYSVDIYRWECTQYQQQYIVKEAWHHVASGTSSGDCGVCAEATGYIGPKGYTTEPLAISFYQSQPLLVQP